MRHGLFLAIDRCLRRFQRIESFSDEPTCLFRIRLVRASKRLPTVEGEIPRGAQVVELHYWNEHVAAVGASIDGLAEATRARRYLGESLALLVRHMEGSDELKGAQAVVGVVAFMSASQARAGKRLLDRLGFSYEPYRSPLGRFGDFWENLYVWCLNHAFTGHGIGDGSFGEVDRFRIWVSRETLMTRIPTITRHAHRSLK